MSSTLYPFDISDIVELYSAFIDDVCHTYGIQNKITERVFQEALQAHVLALLNERTYSLFNTIADDWRARLVEMLFPSGFNLNHYNYGVDRTLSEAEIINQIAYNDSRFDRLNQDLETIIKIAKDKHDPMFTMWDAQYDRTILHISALGDYRIEQWHRDYDVVKTSGESLTVDLTNYRIQLERIINARSLPAYLNGIRKEDILDSVVRNSIGFFLSQRQSDKIASFINLESVSTSPEHTLGLLESYFNLEYRQGIDKLSQRCAIRSYVIYGHSMVIHFDSNVVSTRSYLSRQELERIQAENNGDYIPARQR